MGFKPRHGYRACSGVVRKPDRRHYAQGQGREFKLKGLFDNLVALGICSMSLLAFEAAAHPPLPTACSGGPCGPSSALLPFVSSGLLGNGGLPSVAGNAMTIKQLSDKAILNWADFNIAKGYSVQFVQPGATSSTLNRIWSGDPSIINGLMTANGHVYLINANGIIFGQNAQVNVGSLTASTLKVTDSAFLNGVLNVTSSADLSNGTVNPSFIADAGSEDASITVQNGAVIQATSGGRVMLLAPNISNAGKISTPDGQTILGAGTKVYLLASSDPKLRGLLIAVDGGGNAAHSSVSNAAGGAITADRGNVTLAGLMVNQSGRISATSSVSANGSIYLVAGDVSAGSAFYNSANKTGGFGGLLPNKGGNLTLGSGSITEAHPDPTDTQTVTDGQTYANGVDTFAQSQIGLTGKLINLQGGSAIVAPAATVTVSAASDPYNSSINNVATYGPGTVGDGSRIYVDDGASIDVSGEQSVAVSAQRNLVQIKLQGNELADAPLQRDGFLFKKTVTVDLSKGTPLTDVTPYVNAIQRTVTEKATVGGSIRLDSRGDVITRAGSVLNVSGGSLNYLAGSGHTTLLRGTDGKVYDISTAPKDIQYVGFADTVTLTDAKWGISKTWNLLGNSSSSMLSGYTWGAAAGRIDIAAPAMALEGSMVAKTQPGITQRSGNTLPLGGQLYLGDVNQIQQLASSSTVDLRAPDITITGSLESPTDSLAAGFDVDSALSDSKKNETTLSVAQLNQAGFNHVELLSNGTVTVDADASLTLGAGAFTHGTNTTAQNTFSAFSAHAKSIHIAGTIDATAGDITLTTHGNLVGAVPAQSGIVLDAGAQLLARGAWINDSPLAASSSSLAPLAYNGGSVSLLSYQNVDLAAGSLIDVSGGGWFSATQKLAAGSGGSVTVKANNGGLGSTANSTYAAQLDGAMRGYGLAGGGKLTVQSSTVTVGDTASGVAGELLLRPDFFSSGGFASYDVTGSNRLVITANTALEPQMKNLQLDSGNALSGTGYLSQPSGSDIYGFSDIVTLTLQQLRSPVSVAFAATNSAVVNPNSNPGSLTMETGSSILVDPKASVTLTARENLEVRGNISAPAGTITLATDPGAAAQIGVSDAEGYIPDQELLIGSQARLSATAYAQLLPDDGSGLRKGQVLDSGLINVQANKGYLVTEAGSVLDVSGASTVFDIQTTGAAGPVIQPTAVAGAAGSISLHAREGISLQGDLIGKAAVVPGAAGGTLSLGLDLYDRSVDPNNPSNNLSGNLYPTNARIVTLVEQDITSTPWAPSPASNGKAQVGVAKIAAGGFDTLEVKSSDIIAFDGAVNLVATRSITLDAPVIAGNAGATANVTAAYVALGNANGLYQTVTASTGGNASLAVNASLIDIRGNSTLQGFSTAGFNSQGDIRMTYSVNPRDGSTNFTGSLNTLADLNFSAAQIYPTTLTQFGINAPGRTVSFLPGGNSGIPLSAGAALTVNAADIVQQGTVRAPLGSIALNGSNSVTLGAGSTTSVSAAGATIPFGSVENGRDWVYQLDTQGSTEAIAAPPAKAISLNSTSVNVSSGATLDLSGGGDLYAYEWIAGPGGSKDVLSNTNANGKVLSFATEGGLAAIVPSLGSAYAPIDQQYGLGSGVKTGDSLTISGVPGIKDGSYALLPARYALLPGAYLVQKINGQQDIAPGTVITQRDGSLLVAGKMSVANTGIADSRSSAFLLRSSGSASDTATNSSNVRALAQYNDYSANSFFAAAAATAGAAAPRLPVDAGVLKFTATSSLMLDGNVSFAPGQTAAGQGRGGEADIVAPEIAVVDAVGTADGFLQLTASSLNNLGAQSLILGAGRDGDELTVGSAAVEMRNSTTNVLNAPEIILAATDQVTLKAGSAIAASGTLTNSVTSLTVAGDGALLRVAAGAQSAFVRSNATGAKGTLDVESGASVSASGSTIFDGAKDTRIAADAHVSAPAVKLSSSRINLGDVPLNTGGLALSNQLLSTLQGLTELSLRSNSSIDLWGAVDLGAIDSASGKPVLNSVEFDTAALLGHGTEDKRVRAGNIVLVNNGGAQSATGDGSGALNLVALDNGSPASGNIILGGGDKVVSGFSTLALAAARDVRLVGRGTLNSDGDVSASAARLSADTGAAQQLTASGAVTLNASSTRNDLPDAGIGGSFAVNAARIAVAMPIVMPAGNISLHATGASGQGDIELNSGANIDVAGVARSFADQTAYAAAGSVTLSADHGAVIAHQGAVIDLSGASSNDNSGGDAGSLNISTPSAAFSPDAGFVLKGAAVAGSIQGSVSLDVADLDNFSTLNGLFNTSGFSEARTLRARTGDVSIAVTDTVTTKKFELSADAGGINVAGTVDASGSGGGSIALWAGNDVTLQTGANLFARAAADSSGAGSSVTLSSRDGFVDVQHGTIDVAGGTTSGNGTVLLRASRTAGNNDVQVRASGNGIVNASSIVVEGYRSYDASASGSFDSSLQTTAKNEATSFLGNSAAITSQLGMATASNFRLDAGVEVSSTGDLALPNDIDLSTWKNTSSVVDLTLRAGGNLTLNGSLSDGFTGATNAATLTQADGTTVIPSASYHDGTLTNGASASYRLVAGADFSSAGPLAVKALADLAPASGTMLLSSNKLVRTGDGNIDVAAGRDIQLGNVLPGRPSAPIAPVRADFASDADYNVAFSNYTSALNVTYPAALAVYYAAQANAQTSVIYTAGHPNGNDLVASRGGNLTLNAQHDIVAAASNQLYSNWLHYQPATGTVSNGVITAVDGVIVGYQDVVINTSPPGKKPHLVHIQVPIVQSAGGVTLWGTAFDQFQQGIGALGGGNITVTAGNNIDNLSASIPTSGWLPGAIGDVALTSNIQVRGGGDLVVHADGNIDSGAYFVGRGNAQLSAGGQIAAIRSVGDTKSGLDNGSSAATVGTVLALGDAQVKLQALGDVDIAAILNPTMIPLPQSQNISGDHLFYTYGSASAVDVTSIAGNLVFADGAGSVATAASSFGNTFAHTPQFAMAPSLTGVAMAGNVTAEGASNLFPDAGGNLSLLAANSIQLTGATLKMKELEPASLPGANVLNPISDAAADVVNSSGIVFLPTAVLHQNDTEPVRIIADQGSIVGGTLDFPKAVQVIAGTDVQDISLTAKNLHNSDVTSVIAGRDVVYGTPKDSKNELASNDAGISVAGPGTLEVLAGRNIDLGSSQGIVTRGNLTDIRLASGGASILAAAGLGAAADGSLRIPDIGTFIATYVDSVAGGKTPDHIYSTELTAYVNNFLADANNTTPDLSDAAALAAFRQLTWDQQLPFVANVVYAELRATGIAHNATGASYDQGYSAIATLFPRTDYQGNIDLFYSQIKTEQGGDVNLMVPGGKVTVGPTSIPASLMKIKTMNLPGLPVTLPAEASLGVLVLSDGGIHGFAKDDFLVNTSRMLTLKGGDILLWSSQGNIDAGKGKRTASAAPPPVIRINGNGDVFVDASGAISGSGIGQLLTSPDAVPGRVDLIAPAGEVNAGEAGIRVAGDLNIAAARVVGADNIQVSGHTAGVPASSSNTGTLSAPGGLNDIAKTVENMTESIGKSQSSTPPSLFNVEVIGFGDE